MYRVLETVDVRGMTGPGWLVNIQLEQRFRKHAAAFPNRRVVACSDSRRPGTVEFAVCLPLVLPIPGF